MSAKYIQGDNDHKISMYNIKAVLWYSMVRGSQDHFQEKFVVVLTINGFCVS